MEVSASTPEDSSAVAPQDVDLLESSKPEEYPLLVRKMVKRTLEMFVSNFGSKRKELAHVKKAKTSLKLLDEYCNLDEGTNQETTEHSTNVPLALPSTAPEKPSVAPFSSVEGNTSQITAAFPTRPPPPTSSQAPATSAAALLPLTLATPKYSKPVWHPPWKLMRVISGHQGWVRCLAVDPTNEWFVSGGADRLIKIWDLASGTLKLSLTGHINTIRGLQISSRHPYLFSCAEDNEVKCWDLEQNKVIRNYHGHLSGVYALTLHPTLDILASGGRDAVIRVWDMRTKNPVHILSGHTGAVSSLVSQASEPQIISGSMDKMIRCWDLKAGKCHVTLTNHKKSIRGLALHPREYSFTSAAADNVKVWRCPDGNFERNLDPPKAMLNTVTIKDDPESAVVVGGGDQGFLFFWDWKSGYKFQTIESRPQPGSLASENGIFDVKLDKSETRLLTAECDKTIKVWKEEDQATPETDPIDPRWRPHDASRF